MRTPLDRSPRAADYAIVGGGIVGLATAHELIGRYPDTSIVLLEKETELAAHQTRRNSGVIHSGIYYKPGSLKAKLCLAGNASMVGFCREHSIRHEITGKLIVATEERELPALERLHERGLAHGLDVTLLSPEEAQQHEPHVRCLGAVHVPSTGIVDFGMVASRLAERIEELGVTLLRGERVNRLVSRGRSTLVSTERGTTIEAGQVIACAGLYSDRVVAMASAKSALRIVPFRGEYHEIANEKRHLVKGMIYPVPDDQFPFLGVHLTRHLDGSVHAGPNAVLAFSREGYRWLDVSLRDLASTLLWPGFLRFARRHWRTGLQEMARSLDRRATARSIARMIPEINAEDIRRGSAGVRAQAMELDGNLVDDFRIEREGRNLFVLNAPSPAATSSLEIARHIANEAVSSSSG